MNEDIISIEPSSEAGHPFAGTGVGNGSPSMDELVLAAKAGDVPSLEIVVERLRGVARNIAGSRPTSNIEFEDACAICVEACIVAIGEFDPARGLAMPFFTAKARQTLIDHERRLRVTGRANRWLVHAYADEVEKHGYGAFDLRAFAKAHKVSMRRALRVATTAGGAISLGAPLPHAPFLTVGDTLQCEAPTPVEVAEKHSSIEFLMEHFRTLPDRERTVIERYFGLDGHPVANLAEIGQHLGITGEAVRQILQKGIETMRGRIARMDKENLRLRVKSVSPAAPLERREAPVQIERAPALAA